ncbi:MAG: hypothetical protein ABFD03_10445 [Clostridiaceae bacterium]
MKSKRTQPNSVSSSTGAEPSAGSSLPAQASDSRKRRSFTPTGSERIAVTMENVSSMELFRQPDGSYLKVLYDVNLTIPVGECHGIVGINSFELELLAEIIGNVKPHEEGRCSLLEIGMMRQKRRILPHVYYINDQRVLYDHMHVLRYLMFASEHAPGKPEVKQAQWLRLLLRTGLYPFALTYIRSLNPAEYALVSALLAYASTAKLVVMDLSRIAIPETLIEPFSALTRELTTAGKTVVITNTSCELIQRACTHASFLMDGSIVQNGSVGSLCEAFDHQLLRITSDAPERALAVVQSAFPRVRAVRKSDEVVLYAQGQPAIACTVSQVGAALEHANVPIRSIRAPGPSLLEAFLEVRRTKP